VEPQEKELRLYGARSDRAHLPWSWVDHELARAGTYWVLARHEGHPHPRPVWGVWHEHRLHLSLGSPTLRRALQEDPVVTIHLDSGTDVVIVEGLVKPGAATTPALIQVYKEKYDWDYDLSQYGDLIVVQPEKVLAWRTAGWAGRDSFQTTGCWAFNGQGDRPVRFGSPGDRP
jgi:hypothetical protein